MGASRGVWGKEFRETEGEPIPFDRFPQRTIDWMSLPVLADPFWDRAAFPVRSRSGKTASMFRHWPGWSRLGRGKAPSLHEYKEILCTR